VLSPKDRMSPLNLARYIDRVCDRFEDAFLAGRQPSLEDYLATAPPPVRLELAAELLRVELEGRCRRGDRPALAEYAARFPEHQELVAALLNRASTAAPAPAAPLPAIPGYEILGTLGQGGMAVVYRARQVSLNRPVALKMILAGAYAGARERARFRREAEAAARLRHPNLVQVYEVGEHDGRPFLTLEFVEGGSLAASLQLMPQPVRPSAELLEAVARAMHHAHQCGIVHRDLKPANVLLAPKANAQSLEISDFDPKVTDFGLAKDLDDPSGQTGSGTILGTPSYMAPEQAVAGNQPVGPAADVYALGAVLYEMLTGRPPFKAATVLDTLEQVRSQEPVPPRRLQPKVPRDLETITLKCLEKDPRRRYPGAAELAEDLRAFLDGRPIQARPVGVVEQAVKWARRRPAVAALAATVVCIAALAFGLVTRQWQAAVSARRETDAERQRAERLLVRLSFDRGQALCEQGDVGRGMLRLVHTLEMTPPEPAGLRRAIRAGLSAWAGRLHVLRAVFSHPAAVRSAVFSPNGRVVLTVSADNRARLWDPTRGSAVGPALEHPEEILVAVFSPDGRLVLTGCVDGKARLWRTATGLPWGKPLGHRGAVQAAAFGPAGRTLATGSSDHRLRLWDPATGKLRASVEQREGIVTLAISPDGKLLATGSASGTVRLWTAVTLRPALTSLQAQVTGVRTLSFSPDGTVLVTVSTDDKGKGETAVRLWNTTSGAHIADLKHHYRVRAVAFSPNGRRLATGGLDHLVQVWDSGTGDPVGAPLPHQDAVGALAFSPDGSTLLTGSDDRTARLWDAAQGKPIGQPLEHLGPVHAVAFSPTGRTFLSASIDGTLRLWQPAPARPYPRELRHEGQVMAVAWSPDGQSLVTGTDTGRAWLWQAVTEKNLLARHEDDVWVVAYSPDGKRVLTGSRDRTIRLWDAATGKLERTLRLAHRVRSAAFSPDGRTILTESGNKDKSEARIWDVTTGSGIGPSLAVDGVVWQAAFRPDGKACAISSGENTVRLWDLASRRSVILSPRHQNRVGAVAFSADGTKLLTGSTDKTARLWDARTGKPLGEPLSHPGAVWGVSFSADGSTVVTGDRSGSARLWDVATGTLIGPPMRHQGVVWAVACHPRKRWVLTGSADRTALVWIIRKPVAGSVERVRLGVEVMTGLELRANGVTRPLDASAWKKRSRRLAQLGGLGGPPLLRVSDKVTR
jgi:WD40 repeat protein